MINTVGGWVVNPSMQTIPQMFHPIFNPYQQYGRKIFIKILLKKADEIQ